MSEQPTLVSVEGGVERVLDLFEYRNGIEYPLGITRGTGTGGGGGGTTPIVTGTKLGAYFGNYGEQPDNRFQSLTGQPADVLTTYYQADTRPGGTINAAAENARIANGTIPLITVTSANGPWTHAQIASGAADTWIDYWATQIAALDNGEIWMTFDHEFEVKRNQAKFAWNPSDADYAAAYTRWVSRVRAARALTGKQQVKDIYWWGYFRATEIDNIGALITAQRQPDMLAFDPYVFAHHSATRTFENMCTSDPGKLTWLLQRSWYRGQPIGLAEFGKDGIHGDSECASFLSDLRPRMEALGLYFAIYFARDKPGDVMLDLTPAGTFGPWPGISSYSKGDGSMANYAQSVPAFIASVVGPTP